MSSDEDFVKFVVEQMEDAGAIRSRKMFGDYVIYCNDKVFVKPTEGGRTFIGENIIEAPAYQGANNSFFIEDKFENKEWISELIRITETELPLPKPKKKDRIR